MRLTDAKAIAFLPSYYAKKKVPNVIVHRAIKVLANSQCKVTILEYVQLKMRQSNVADTEA